MLGNLAYINKWKTVMIKNELNEMITRNSEIKKNYQKWVTIEMDQLLIYKG